MEDGKVNKALKLLEGSNGGILPLTEKTFEALLEKHPNASNKASNDILIEEVQNAHPLIYGSIGSEHVYMRPEVNSNRFEISNRFEMSFHLHGNFTVSSLEISNRFQKLSYLHRDFTAATS